MIIGMKNLLSVQSLKRNMTFRYSKGSYSFSYKCYKYDRRVGPQ